jgi:hypothetical protein
VIDQLTVSWSEIDAGRQCKLKHKLSYKDRWTMPVADNSALGKGVLWHLVMETHYKVIMDAQALGEGGRMVWMHEGRQLTADELMSRCNAAVDKLLSKASAGGHDSAMVHLAGWMYDGYTAVYGLDDEHDILGVETTHLAPLGSIVIDSREVPVTLKFTIDRTIRDKRGDIRVLDEKSCANLPRDSDFDFLDQFGLYTWGLRALGINVRGAIHSAARTTRNQGDIIKPGDEGYKKSMKAQTLDERFKRTNIAYTKAQLDDVRQSALDDVQELYSSANRHQRQADSDRCKWRCSFTEACLFGRRTGKMSETIKMLELQGFTQERERH